MRVCSGETFHIRDWHEVSLTGLLSLLLSSRLENLGTLPNVQNARINSAEVIGRGPCVPQDTAPAKKDGLSFVSLLAQKRTRRSWLLCSRRSTFFSMNGSAVGWPSALLKSRNKETRHRTGSFASLQCLGQRRACSHHTHRDCSQTSVPLPSRL